MAEINYGKQGDSLDVITLTESLRVLKRYIPSLVILFAIGYWASFSEQSGVIASESIKDINSSTYEQYSFEVSELPRRVRNITFPIQSYCIEDNENCIKLATATIHDASQMEDDLLIVLETASHAVDNNPNRLVIDMRIPGLTVEGVPYCEKIGNDISLCAIRVDVSNSTPIVNELDPSMIQGVVPSQNEEYMALGYPAYEGSQTVAYATRLRYVETVVVDNEVLDVYEGLSGPAMSGGPVVNTDGLIVGRVVKIDAQDYGGMEWAYEPRGSRPRNMYTYVERIPSEHHDLVKNFTERAREILSNPENR